MKRLLICLLLVAPFVHGLDNGLALSPPMGWLSWLRYECTTTCDASMENCISEALFKRVANDLVRLGFHNAGYNYVIIDDCWLDKERDASGRLQPDKKRFPSGINALADYIHGKKLKFGMYEDYGTKTCAGYPGIYDHLEIDAQTFADWNVDYLKIDGCNAGLKDYETGYPAFGAELNKTGRPIVYSCSWPAYWEMNKWNPDYKAIMDTCNLWRNYYDIGNSWSSVQSIIDFYGERYAYFSNFTKPGAWFDPDMLVIGNGALTLDQSRAQMAIWSVLAAPLILSTNLTELSADEKAILLNPDVIAIDQDPMGIYGERVMVVKLDGVHWEVWTRKVLPVVCSEYSFAIVAWNRSPQEVTVQVPLANLTGSDSQYKLRDLFDPKNSPQEPTKLLDVKVAPNGAVRMLKAVPILPKCKNTQ